MFGTTTISPSLIAFPFQIRSQFVETTTKNDDAYSRRGPTGNAQNAQVSSLTFV